MKDEYLFGHWAGPISPADGAFLPTAAAADSFSICFGVGIRQTRGSIGHVSTNPHCE